MTLVIIFLSYIEKHGDKYEKFSDKKLKTECYEDLYVAYNMYDQYDMKLQSLHT